jgi:MtrB/PioB family decaheme-associated outer membrane protein
MSQNTKFEFKLLPVAAAILLAYGNAYAEESSEVRSLMTPETFASIGVSSVNSATDAKRFAEYTGLNQRFSPLLEFEINKRNEADGLWTIMKGRNLGTETGEMSLTRKKQGDWKLAIDYNEIVRLDPYIIHTGMGGIGSTTPTVNLIATPTMPAAWATANGYAASNGVQGSDVELKLKRTAVGVSGDKWITPELQIELSFRNEDKKGARMFGRAGLGSSDMLYTPSTSIAGGYAILLTPEPIDSSTRTIESKINFNRDKLALTGGYFGSFYVNNNGSMSPGVPGTLNRGALGAATGAGATLSSSVQQLASSSVALPPDNQAHQLYASGNYAFSDTTRTNFKVAYTHATQDESFIGAGLTPSATAPASLGGVVDTTLAQVGLTMRPLKELSVNASLRYEDRNDKTPVYVYNYGKTGGALDKTTNWPSGSQTRTTVKVDGIYRLPMGYSITLGTDWERKSTPLPSANTALFNKQVFFRPVLNETGIHAEVRKAISETVNGALGVDYKQRRGNDSDWVTTTGTAGNALLAFDPSLAATPAVVGPPAVAANSGGNIVLPDMYMDRNRTKARANIDWEATEKLSLQTVLEHTQDNYLRAFPTSITPAQVVPTDPGARTINSDSISLDSTYLVSEEWRVNGFWTRSFNRWNVNKANLGDDTNNTADTFGVGTSGKVTARFSLGIDVLSTRETTTFNNVVATAVAGQTAGNIAGFSAAIPGNYLPNIDYRTDKLNIRGKYALDKVSDVLVGITYMQFETNDWQWGYNGTPYVYSDNTTVSQPARQTLKLISANYLLRF